MTGHSKAAAKFLLCLNLDTPSVHFYVIHWIHYVLGVCLSQQDSVSVSQTSFSSEPNCIRVKNKSTSDFQHSPDHCCTLHCGDKQVCITMVSVCEVFISLHQGETSKALTCHLKYTANFLFSINMSSKKKKGAEWHLYSLTWKHSLYRLDMFETDHRKSTAHAAPLCYEVSLNAAVCLH